MRCVLTDKKIASIKADLKRQELWDLSLPGFGMRVAKGGQKTFFVMCRDKGRQRRISLGRYPIITLAEARDAARDKLRLISQGLSLEDKKPEVMTVEQVFNNFIELYAKKKNKDWQRTQARLANTLIKEYGPLDIREITRENIIALLDKIVARNAPIQANRVLAGVSKFFKWCAERGYIENSPVLYISKPAKENPRDRVLSDDEVALIWGEADKMGYPFGSLLKILILTGQRKGEVSDMRWSEINLKDKIWTIPKERSKNGHAHAVPLSSQVLKILETVPRFLHSDLVFTTTGKTPVSGFGRVKARLDDASGVSGWIIHDIRRTVASGMARLKVSPYVVEKVLNHISGTFSSVTGVYNRYGYDDEKRRALEIWGIHIEDIQNERANNIRRIF
ncbi:tyrosine-type recombinase/integrase [Micavibrio aeruginosavorus]|uniref:Phage integrase family protein n=1 Tax=Micavibrio aeruginosavorus (strain ARL-13) TaxID=856793 RepID=G2KQ17_MICAA|nr:site-specific integrase [Micavibrio aeruginosavorus]AEP10385.1 phage integrase family protein [Micavibrio aeruginosavorus ARL-13]